MVSAPSRRRAQLRALALIASGPAFALLVVASVLVGRAAPARAATTTIPIGEVSIYGFYFCDASHIGNVCTTTIQVGDSVVWQNTTATDHTSTECDGVCGSIPASPLWDLSIGPNASTAPLQFNQAGTFNYQCNVHPTQMKGAIVVQAAPQTATPTSTPGPVATPTPPAVGGVSLDPAAGAGASPAAELVAGIAAAVLASGGLAWAMVYARRRSR